MVRIDSAGRDSLGSIRVTVNSDAISRMIRELLASRELEQTIGYALREAATGEKADTRKMKELSGRLDEIARRNAGLVTTLQMQCAHEGPLPEGFLGVEFDQQSISQHDNEPAMFELGTVESVTPGSPADKAGLQRGDVLLSIGGVDARKPIALGTILKPGAKVQVRLQRGRVTKDVAVVVEKRPADYGSDCATMEHWDAPMVFMRTPAPGSAPRAPRIPAPAMAPEALMPPPGSGFAYAFTPMANIVLGGATLQMLDDDWRQALGVDNGVLVQKVAPGSPARDAGLRGSDVIISADGETVGSPRSLQRIMGAKSNLVKLQIVRAGKTQTILLRWQNREP